MVSAETLLNYHDWEIPFTVHTDVSDKHLVDVISTNDKPISLFVRKLRKPPSNYNMTWKDLLSIVQCLNQFCANIIGYKINVYSVHKNLIQAATWSEYQRVNHWQLILKEFGHNIHHISVVDNIVSDTLSRFSSTTINRDKPSANRDLS